MTNQVVTFQALTTKIVAGAAATGLTVAGLISTAGPAHARPDR